MWGWNDTHEPHTALPPVLPPGLPPVLHSYLPPSIYTFIHPSIHPSIRCSLTIVGVPPIKGPPLKIAQQQQQNMAGNGKKSHQTTMYEMYRKGIPSSGSHAWPSLPPLLTPSHLFACMHDKPCWSFPFPAPSL